MHLCATLSVAYLVPSPIFVNAQDVQSQIEAPTITSSASLACATGQPLADWLACSSSVSSGMNGCGAADLGCACGHANIGFNCLASYCSQQTSAVCEASLALEQMCNVAQVPGPVLTNFTCPSAAPDILASIIRSEISSLILNVVHNRTMMQSSLQSGTSRANGPLETGTETRTINRTFTSMFVPHETGLSGGKKAVEGWLGREATGRIAAVVAVGGMATWL